MARISIGPIAISKDLKIPRHKHAVLLQYLKARLDWANQTHIPFVEKLRAIDKEVSGHILLDADDTKRERENAKGFGLKPTDVKLPMTLVQIDEAVTVLLQMLAPDEGMYSAVAAVEKQQVAKGFTALMNNNDKQYGHYTNLNKALGSLMKYNVMGLAVDWDETRGNKVVTGQSGLPETVEATLRAGNTLEALSMYNTLWDPSVKVTDIPTKGEFFATVKLHTPFRVKKMEKDGDIVGASDVLSNSGSYEHSYYQLLPELRNSFQSQSSKIPNWHEVFNPGTGKTASDSIEFVTMPIWINPKELGLSRSDKLEIWRFTIANGTRIVDAVHLTNAHAMLPATFAVALDDEMELNTKTYAELLTPFNRFSSFQMNVHQRAARKSLYGLTFYLKRFVPALGDDDIDMASGKIPVEGNIEDIRKAIVQYFDAPNTANTLQDISSMDELMQKVLPTDVLKQVTDLERATRYQAAATVQGTDRRCYKIAKLIDSFALQPARLMQMYNIFEYQEEMEMIGPDGKLVTVDPAEFRDADLEFSVSDGLSGIDKLGMQEGYKEVLNSILQSQTASERIDVVAVINYISTLWGDKTDFAQFAYQTEFDKLTPDEKNIALQLLQRAQAAQQGAPA